MLTAVRIGQSESSNLLVHNYQGLMKQSPNDEMLYIESECRYIPERSERYPETAKYLTICSPHSPAPSPPVSFRAYFVSFSEDELLSPPAFFLLDCPCPLDPPRPSLLGTPPPLASTIIHVN